MPKKPEKELAIELPLTRIEYIRVRRIDTRDELERVFQEAAK